MAEATGSGDAGGGNGEGGGNGGGNGGGDGSDGDDMIDALEALQRDVFSRALRQERRNSSTQAFSCEEKVKKRYKKKKRMTKGSKEST